MIKFRVWDKEEKKMHKVKTIEFSRRGARIIHLAEVQSNGKGDHKRWHSSVELMQSTGLKDKNGVEIYEGDILKILVMSVSDKYVYGEVVYEYGVSGLKNVLNGWGYEQGLIPLLEVGHVYEVVGNIYENPELLEGD